MLYLDHVDALGHPSIRPLLEEDFWGYIRKTLQIGKLGEVSYGWFNPVTIDITSLTGKSLGCPF